jgi:hypothetical protein
MAADSVRSWWCMGVTISAARSGSVLDPQVAPSHRRVAFHVCFAQLRVEISIQSYLWSCNTHLDTSAPPAAACAADTSCARGPAGSSLAIRSATASCCCP